MSTAKAASNGNTATAPASKPERPTGYARLREAEVYHASSVMQDAAFEAERLCEAIYRTVSDVFRNRLDLPAGPTTVEVAESPEIRAKAIEALRCLRVAEEYLYRFAPVMDQPSF